ncbi:MAG TPA: hypothetical protein VLQ90_08930 [Pyrinomonadaceae bacterium]|nr:hypothetical protein [Pyrinomonadaceae bacterium]
MTHATEKTSGLLPLAEAGGGAVAISVSIHPGKRVASASMALAIL